VEDLVTRIPVGVVIDEALGIVRLARRKCPVGVLYQYAFGQ